MFRYLYGHAGPKEVYLCLQLPNNIPLPPRDVEQIWIQMRNFHWSDTFGGWSGRHILSDSRRKLLHSARYYVDKEGHSPDAFEALSEEAALSLFSRLISLSPLAQAFRRELNLFVRSHDWPIICTSLHLSFRPLASSALERRTLSDFRSPCEMKS